MGAGSMASNRLTFDADEFTGSGTLEKTFEFRGEAVPLLLRAINELDAQVTVEILLTDGLDEAVQYPVSAAEITLLGGDGNPDAGNGSAGSDLLTEPWERCAVQVTPAEAPQAGHLKVRTATDSN